MKHFISASCGGEKCGYAVTSGDGKASYCLEPATHKVGEEIPHDDPNSNRHNYTMYVCCLHFGQIFGTAAQRNCEGDTYDYSL